jgi:hypothetical protein
VIRCYCYSLQPNRFTERELTYILSGRVPLTPINIAIERIITHYRRLQSRGVFHVKDLE